MTVSEPGVPADTALLPVEQYVAGLARKRMAAGVLFHDGAGRVLLVQPSYKPNWDLPGGAVEADESPWATATRELAEEPDLVGLAFPDAEIRSAGLHTLEQARSKVKPLLADRLAAALEAAATGMTALCEQGRRIA